MQRLLHPQNLRLLLAALFAAVGLVAAAPVALAAPVGSSDEVCQAISDLGGGSNCDTEDAPGASVNSIIETAVKLLSYVAGVVAVIMLIAAGLIYITSNGDPKNISHAKSAIIYALVGMVVVAMAQFIVRYVLNQAGE